MYEFSDSMYVVFCFNSWCPMKIVTIPIPYSKYRGTIIYVLQLNVHPIMVLLINDFATESNHPTFQLEHPCRCVSKHYIYIVIFTQILMYIIYIIFICTLKYITVNRCTHLKGALKKKHRTRASWRKSDSFLRSGTEIGDSLPWTWAFPHLVQQLEAVGSHASGAGMQDFVAIKNLLGLVLSCEVHGPQLVDDIIWILHWHLDTYFATFWTKLTHPLQVGGSWRHIPSRLEASLDLICVGNKFGPSQQHSLSEYNKSLTKRLVAKMFKLIGVLA